MPTAKPTTVRSRHTTDLSACAALLGRVYRVDRYPVQGVSRAKEFLSSPTTLAAWIAVSPSDTESDVKQDSNSIVGHVSLTSPSPSDPAVALWLAQKHSEPIAVLERLFVDPDARGRGVAEALMRTASAEAERRGVKAVLFALVKDAGAMRLYERVGWREFGRSMYAYRDHEGRETEMEAVCYSSPGRF